MPDDAGSPVAARVDLDRFRFLVDLLERKEAGLALRTLESFADGARGHLATAGREAKGEPARLAIHSLKGAAGTFGADRLVEMLAAAEAKLRSGHSVEVQRLEAELAATLAELRGLVRFGISQPA